MKNKMKIAIYLRLSKEDEWITQESNSISCQRLLLKGYIERNFENYEIMEFVDDGYSGTSMDRPGMKEMLTCQAEENKLYYCKGFFPVFQRLCRNRFLRGTDISIYGSSLYFCK